MSVEIEIIHDEETIADDDVEVINSDEDLTYISRVLIFSTIVICCLIVFCIAIMILSAAIRIDTVTYVFGVVGVVLCSLLLLIFAMEYRMGSR